MKWNLFPHQAETILCNQENYLLNMSANFSGGSFISDAFHLYMIRIFWYSPNLHLETICLADNDLAHLLLFEILWRSVLFYISI